MRVARLLVLAPVVLILAGWGAFARRSFAAEALWQTDFKAAQSKAKNEKKYLLVDFTGSDWCPWCIKLHKEVFEMKPFLAEAPKQFVLVELDFPHDKELPPDLEKQNKELSDKYDVKGFPTVLLLDAGGEVIARTGYRPGGAEPYLEYLAELPKVFQNVVAWKAGLDKAHGLDRAKLMDQIIEGYAKLGKESEEVAGWTKEIIALDSDNKGGLKAKYGLSEANRLAQSGESAEAAELLDEILALKGVSGDLRQELYLTKARICLMQRKFSDAVATLKLAKDAAPQSPNVKHIEDGIQQLTKAAAAQKTAADLEPRLAKAEGLDRARLLDQLVDAKQTLTRFDPQAGENLQKWSKEIVALDPDNKTGLKKKHEFKMTLADADELTRVGKIDEANAALDKALESGGISGEEVQQAELLKARLAFMQRSQSQGVAHLKKALAAAPKGEFAPVIKMMIDQFEKGKPGGENPAE